MGARPSRYDHRGFGGKNRFWFNGRCVTGPDYRGTLLTLLLIFTLAALAFSITFPWLVDNRPGVGIPLTIVALIAVSISVVACWLAATTDPGIIPRAAHPPPSARRDRTIVIRGRTVLIKYCETCKIWRPPRTSHCATCNNCVQRFDHHCPWLGNDIGARNYRSYFAFVSSSAVACIAVISGAVTHLIVKTDHFMVAKQVPHLEAMRQTFADGPTAVNLFIILICLLALAFTGGLTGFHIYLMSMNITTAESFKKSNRNSSHDHDDLRGCAAIKHLQCTPRAPSAISQGYADEPHPDYNLIMRLIAAQVEEEAVAVSAVTAPTVASSTSNSNPDNSNPNPASQGVMEDAVAETNPAPPTTQRLPREDSTTTPAVVLDVNQLQLSARQQRQQQQRISNASLATHPAAHMQQIV